MKSLNIDTRLFDPDFNAATAEELADTLSLVDHLGKSNESVEVYLGNLFYKGFTPGPKDDNKARIKLVHLKAVNEFFNNEISFGELKEKLYHFYRLTSKGINGENQLHHSLTLKIGQSLEKLQLLKSLYEEHKNVERLFKDDVDVYSKAELSRKLIELQLRIDEVKNQMDVIIDPQTAPWAYLVAGIPRFGEKARERREWLLSNEDPVVGIIGLLQNGDLFADIDNNSLEDYWNKNEPETSQAEFFSHFDKQDDPKNILKVRRLLRYYHALLAMDSYSFPGEKDPTYRSFDAIAEMSSLLVNSWEDLKTFIDELGLEKDPRFEGMLHVGNRLAQTSATGIKYGGLGDVMSTSLDRAVSTSASPVIFEEVGGIDLNSQFIDFERIGSSSQAIFPGQFMQTEPAVFNGLKPVIIRITPVINIPQLLGASS